jgi:hypothetical protein
MMKSGIFTEAAKHRQVSESRIHTPHICITLVITSYCTDQLYPSSSRIMKIKLHCLRDHPIFILKLLDFFAAVMRPSL